MTPRSAMTTEEHRRLGWVMFAWLLVAATILSAAMRSFLSLDTAGVVVAWVVSFVVGTVGIPELIRRLMRHRSSAGSAAWRPPP